MITVQELKKNVAAFVAREDEAVQEEIRKTEALLLGASLQGKTFSTYSPSYDKLHKDSQKRVQNYFERHGFTSGTRSVHFQ